MGKRKPKGGLFGGLMQGLYNLTVNSSVAVKKNGTKK